MPTNKIMQAALYKPDIVRRIPRRYYPGRINTHHSRLREPSTKLARHDPSAAADVEDELRVLDRCVDDVVVHQLFQAERLVREAGVLV